MGTTPSTWKFGSKWPRWSEIADFRSIFTRNASVVTPSETSFINTNIGSPVRAFQCAKDEHRTLSLSPQRLAQKSTVSKIWTISRDNSETVRILITNRKSRTGFRLIPTSMTLNDLERRNSPYFAFFCRIPLLCWPSMSQWLNRPIMSVNIVSQFQSSTFGHN